jgi:hypothetical protein
VGVLFIIFGGNGSASRPRLEKLHQAFSNLEICIISI